MDNVQKSVKLKNFTPLRFSDNFSETAENF